MLEELFFRNELKEILVNNGYDLQKYKRLSKNDKKLLNTKFKDIALYHSFEGMMINEDKFRGYLRNSKFNILLAKD